MFCSLLVVGRCALCVVGCSSCVVCRLLFLFDVCRVLFVFGGLLFDSYCAFYVVGCVMFVVVLVVCYVCLLCGVWWLLFVV